jgi:hypothetical protein
LLRKDWGPAGRTLRKVGEEEKIMGGDTQLALFGFLFFGEPNRIIHTSAFENLSCWERGGGREA